MRCCRNHKPSPSARETKRGECPLRDGRAKSGEQETQLERPPGSLRGDTLLRSKSVQWIGPGWGKKAPQRADKKSTERAQKRTARRAVEKRRLVRFFDIFILDHTSISQVLQGGIP